MTLEKIGNGIMASIRLFLVFMVVVLILGCRGGASIDSYHCYTRNYNHECDLQFRFPPGRLVLYNPDSTVCFSRDGVVDWRWREEDGRMIYIMSDGRSGWLCVSGDTRGRFIGFTPFYPKGLGDE